MKVTVRSVGLIKMLLGGADVQVTLPDGSTVTDLLARLREEKGEKFSPFAVEPKEASAHAPLRVMVNGRDISALEGRHTVLKDGDDVLMFLPIAGG
jgi:molybdopterin converting factor small subunit